MRTIRLALLVFGVSISAASQNSSQSQPDTTPAPAFGQSAPVLNPENPPVSGLDTPGLDLHTATRSFFSPALQVSESGDSNGANQIGSTGADSITRVLGAFDLQQFWPKSDLFLEYLGGGAFYSSPFDVQQLQAVGLDAVTRWRTGQLTLRDAFNYLPDGSFQIGTVGGLPGFGLASGTGTGAQIGGLPGTFGSGQFGSVGNIPRLSNTAILDAVQALNPVSAITMAVGFANAHFYDSGCSGDGCLINSDLLTAEGGYSHLLSRHDQIGVVYAFQLLQFPIVTGGQIYNDVLYLRWSHLITGRLSLSVGVGPQYTELEEQGQYNKNWSVSGRFLLRYKIGRASVMASYEKFTSPGSGFYAGADTQVARLGYKRPVGRTWDFYGDVDYSNNKRLQTLFSGGVPLGVNTGSYNEGSAGFVLRKHLGRTYDFFVAYRFSDVSFATGTTFPTSLCPSGNCTTTERNAGAIGVEWHPTPTRIE
jgi:hypothetical protein